MIGVSIVVYNTPSDELQSIVRKCCMETQVGGVCIIDNNSKSRVDEKSFDSDKVVVIRNNNTGYVAHNLGMEVFEDRGFEYHLIINSDIDFEHGTLDSISDILDRNKAVGLMMPKIVYPNGELQRVAKFLPNPLEMLFRMLGLKRIFCIETPSNSLVPIFVPYLSGCFMFMRREHLDRCGYMDERFFMYAEDIDLSRRMAKIALNLYFPGITVTHKHGRASKKKVKLLIVHIVNLVKYFNKWGWWVDADRVRLNDKCGRYVEISMKDE